MAVFGPLQLTTQGQALYAKAQTGTTLTFTRMQIGGGQLNGQDQTKLTSLISPIAYFSINSESTNGNTSSVTGIFENTNLTTSTYVCEIGLFAQDPTAGEILYSYSNAGTQGDTLPPYANGPISRQYNFSIAIGNSTSVTANISPSAYLSSSNIGVSVQKVILPQSTAPSNPQNNDLWIDESTTPNILKRYNTSTISWVQVGSVTNIATTSTVGTVKVGNGINLQPDGTISVNVFNHLSYWIQ